MLQHFCFQSVLHVPQKPVTSGKDDTDEEWSSLSEDDDEPDGQQDMEENTEEQQENEDVADISNILEETVLYSDEDDSSANLTDYEPLPELTEEKGNKKSI